MGGEAVQRDLGDWPLNCTVSWIRLAARYYLDVSCPADEAMRRALNVTTMVNQPDRDLGAADINGCDHGEYANG
jgi:hypothetical protein